MTNIVAITLNPSIDISTSVDRLMPIRKLRCAAPRVYPGGGGVNVARVAVRFGADVELIYPTGGATGQLLRRLVDREGIPNLAIDLKEETREDFTVLEETTGAEFRFVMPGPQFAEDEWQKCLEALIALQAKPDFIVGSGSLPPGVPNDFYARVARHAANSGARFVVDTSGDALAAALQEGVFLVKPNLRELNEMLRVEAEDDASMLAAGRQMIRDHHAEVVALSLGDLGALLVTGDRAWRAHAPQINIVSGVGAGDSFLGALLWAMCASLPMPEALRYAVAAGAAAVLTPGTALCERDEVEHLLPHVRVEQVHERAGAWS
ncbi:MAG TPA: 1-phosphofructokinase family hexose kinase [Xanthobacteraceae bacterium]|jgi:6-phosphofructokinase 2